MDILIVILLVVIIALISFNIFNNGKKDGDSDDFLKGIDRSIETQITTI